MPVRRPCGRRGRASHRACRPRRPRTGPGRPPGGRPPGISSCAIPAWVGADGKVLASGGCAGNFLISAPAVTVRAGQQIEVQMLQEEAIPGSQRVCPAYRFRAARTAGSWPAPLPARTGHGDLHRDAPRARHAGNKGRLPSARPTPIRAEELPGNRRHGDLRPADPGNCRRLHPGLPRPELRWSQSWTRG